MKYVAKIGRHYTSYQVVLPKRLIKELGWQFQDFVVITPDGPDAMRIESLENWAKAKKVISTKTKPGG